MTRHSTTISQHSAATDDCASQMCLGIRSDGRRLPLSAAKRDDALRAAVMIAGGHQHRMFNIEESAPSRTCRALAPGSCLLPLPPASASRLWLATVRPLGSRSVLAQARVRKGSGWRAVPRTDALGVTAWVNRSHFPRPCRAAPASRKGPSLGEPAQDHGSREARFPFPWFW